MRDAQKCEFVVGTSVGGMVSWGSVAGVNYLDVRHLAHGRVSCLTLLGLSALLSAVVLLGGPAVRASKLLRRPLFYRRERVCATVAGRVLGIALGLVFGIPVLAIKHL